MPEEFEILTNYVTFKARGLDEIEQITNGLESTDIQVQVGADIQGLEAVELDVAFPELTARLDRAKSKVTELKDEAERFQNELVGDIDRAPLQGFFDFASRGLDQLGIIGEEALERINVKALLLDKALEIGEVFLRDEIEVRLNRIDNQQTAQRLEPVAQDLLGDEDGRRFSQEVQNLADVVGSNGDDIRQFASDLLLLRNDQDSGISNIQPSDILDAIASIEQSTNQNTDVDFSQAADQITRAIRDGEVTDDEIQQISDLGVPIIEALRDFGIQNPLVTAGRRPLESGDIVQALARQRDESQVQERAGAFEALDDRIDRLNEAFDRFINETFNSAQFQLEQANEAVQAAEVVGVDLGQTSQQISEAIRIGFESATTNSLEDRETRQLLQRIALAIENGVLPIQGAN